MKALTITLDDEDYASLERWASLLGHHSVEEFATRELTALVFQNDHGWTDAMWPLRAAERRLRPREVRQ